MTSALLLHTWKQRSRAARFSAAGSTGQEQRSIQPAAQSIRTQLPGKTGVMQRGQGGSCFRGALMHSWDPQRIIGKPFQLAKLAPTEGWSTSSLWDK